MEHDLCHLPRPCSIRGADPAESFPELQQLWLIHAVEKSSRLGLEDPPIADERLENPTELILPGGVLPMVVNLTINEPPKINIYPCK